MSIHKSKYSRDDRKHIVESIESLKNDEDYVAIFEILTDDPSNTYSQNSNGVFLNLSAVNDKTLYKICRYIKKVNKNKPEITENDVDIIPLDNGSKHNNRTHKLSNYEKNIIKQRNLKKILDNDNHYEEMKFASKKNTKKKNIKKEEDY